jgi:hypothetical protein
VIDALQSGSSVDFCAGKEESRCRVRSYSAATRTSFCHVAHITERYAYNRMEASHQPTRHNGFSPSIARSKICSGSDAT